MTTGVVYLWGGQDLGGCARNVLHLDLGDDDLGMYL